MQCESGCFETEVFGCEEVLLPITLAPMTSYKALIQRPGQKTIYERSTTTNSVGNPILSDYPAGLFNRGEIFKATINNEAGEVVQFLVEGETYSCLQITIKEHQ